MSDEKITQEESDLLDESIEMLAVAISKLNSAFEKLDKLSIEYGWNIESWLIGEYGLKIASVLSTLVKERMICYVERGAK